jgi:hypothetical protein
MTPNNEIENVWKKCKAREAAPAPMTGKDLQAIISSRVRKELKTVSQFVLGALVYQTLLYSFLTHTLVRHWGDMQIMLLCFAAGAFYILCFAAGAFYIPLTIALVRRVRTLYGRCSAGSPVQDVFLKVESEYARLADLFQFKKRMDWIGVPVSCAIIVLVTFTLFVPGGVAGNPVAGLVVFALWVGICLIAIHAENRKLFISPLRHLKQVLDDVKNP